VVNYLEKIARKMVIYLENIHQCVEKAFHHGILVGIASALSVLDIG